MGIRGKAKPAAERALLMMVRAYFKGKGYRVSSITQDGDIVVVRFPDGGPHGVKRGHYGPLAIQKIEESFLK